MTDFEIKKPGPNAKYKYSFTIPKEEREATDRMNARAEELGINLYVLDGDTHANKELQDLEDYIVDNFIDMDLDVPEDVKERYLQLKKLAEGNHNN